MILNQVKKKELLVRLKKLKFFVDFLCEAIFFFFEDTQKGFTNKLRSLIKSNYRNENQTLGYFEQNEPNVMRNIKSKFDKKTKHKEKNVIHGIYF